MSIDEIYDLFIWDASYSDEEYNLRVCKGFLEASKLKNLYPFIQPLTIPPEKSKSAWEACAEVVARRTDEELTPYLYLLFEWLQDMNWPGAVRIYTRLSRIPAEKRIPALQYSKHRAEEANDELWILALENFQKGEQYPECYEFKEIV